MNPVDPFKDYATISGASRQDAWIPGGSGLYDRMASDGLVYTFPPTAFIGAGPLALLGTIDFRYYQLTGRAPDWSEPNPVMFGGGLPAWTSNSSLGPAPERPTVGSPRPSAGDALPTDQGRAGESPASPIVPRSVADIVAPDGVLPGDLVSGSPGGRNMPASPDPNAAALAYVEALFQDNPPLFVRPIDPVSGAFYAQLSDGSFVTYRPAGVSSERTPSDVASVDINGPEIKERNGDKALKLKFPRMRGQ